MKILKNIVVSLKDPEQNGCDASTKLSSDSIYKTYAIMNDDGECIEGKYKGINCLPKVVLYDTNHAVVEIKPDFLFYVKLKMKEYADRIS